MAAKRPNQQSRKSKPDISTEEINPAGLPWFSFHAKKWVNSKTVRAMTDAERGVYVQIMAWMWILGSLPLDAWELSKQLSSNYQLTNRWLTKWGNPDSGLVVVCESDDSRFILPNVAVLSSKLENTDHSSGHNTREIDNSDNTQEKDAVSSELPNDSTTAFNIEDEE